MPKPNTTTIKIWFALRGRNKLTWSQLLEKTDISKGALSTNLKRLIEMDFVETQVDTVTRPATTYYKLTPEGWRRQKLWVKEWDEEMQETQKFLGIILELSYEQKKRFKSILEKYIKLEDFERREREREYDIEESGDDLVLRHRKTGRITAVIHSGFPEDRKKKKKG